MKTWFIIGLAGFWAFVVVVAIGGLLSFEKEKATLADTRGDNTNPSSVQTDVSGTQNIASTNGGTSNVAGAEYMNTEYVAIHNTEQNCWLVISNKIYSVTDYIPFHPGGKTTIIPLCGKEATDAFTTKGGKGKHSVNAWALLENYFIADFNSVIPGTEQTDTTSPATTTPTGEPVVPPQDQAVGVSKFVIGDRVETTDGLSVRKTPGSSGEKLASEILGARGTVKGKSTWADGTWWAYVTYTDGKTGWSTELYLKKSVGVPVPVVPTTPVPTPVPPAQTTSLTAASVATHNTAGNCYLIINNKVYDVTQYIPFHPGGTAAITNYCGKEATNAFNTKGGGGSSHSTNANNLLANYYIGTIGAVVPVSTTDTTAPTVSFQSPLNGSTIAGSVTLSAFASDASGIASVKFSVDGSTLKIDSTSPYNATLDTTGYSNSSHTLKLDATDKAGNTNSASISVTISNTTTPTPVGTLTSAEVATHNTAGNCYLIINNKVYDVTQYIPFHPGGTAAITNYCGKEATNAFNTKGGGGSSHSTNANNLLANYYIGTIGAVVPTTTTCTSFSYGSWSTCQPSGTQTRTVSASSPSGCTGGSPITTQSCTYTPPVTSGGGLTSAQVATHNSVSDCYLIVSNRVYDVTQYIPFHPGGTTRITSRCGTDGTSAFLTSSAGHAHSNSAKTLLENYYVGDLSTGTTGGTGTTCSSFTYSSWGTCQSNSTQTRTVTSTSPSGCTGGSPITTQSCTYTPPSGGGGGGGQTHSVSISSSGSFNPSSLTISVGDSITFSWTSGDEQQVSVTSGTVTSCKLDHENTSCSSTFNSAGTWTFSTGGGSGTVTVQ